MPRFAESTLDCRSCFNRALPEDEASIVRCVPIKLNAIEPPLPGVRSDVLGSMPRSYAASAGRWLIAIRREAF